MGRRDGGLALHVMVEDDAHTSFLGLGKGDVEIRNGEERLAAALRARDIPLSVVRVGAIQLLRVRDLTKIGQDSD